MALTDHYRRVRNLFTRLSTSLTLAGAMTFQALAIAAPAPDSALVEQVWQTTRLEALSQAMAKNLLQGIRHHPDLQTLTLERRDRLIAHYQRYTSASRFAHGLRRVLEESSTEQLLALLHLSQSQVARQALKHELSFVPVSADVMYEYAVSLEGSPEGQVRREAIRRLDRAIGVTDVAVTVSATTLYGTAMAMQELNASAPATVPGDLNRLVSRFIEQARPKQAQMIEVTYLYLYRHMSAQDLSQYVGLQEHQAVQSTQRRFVRSLGEEMIGIQRDVLRDLIKDMQGRGERQA